MESEDIVYKIMQHIVNYSMLNIIVFGLMGNFLCFRIFTSTKLNKYPISIYFRAISIFDSLVLFHSFHVYIKDNSDFNIINVNDFLCKFWSYFLYATGPMSGWLMVIVSLDRFLCIMFPRRFPFIHKKSVQMVIIFSLVFFNFTLYSSMIWRSELKIGITKQFYFKSNIYILRRVLFF